MADERDNWRGEFRRLRKAYLIRRGGLPLWKAFLQRRDEIRTLSPKLKGKGLDDVLEKEFLEEGWLELQQQWEEDHPNEVPSKEAVQAVQVELKRTIVTTPPDQLPRPESPIPPSQQTGRKGKAATGLVKGERFREERISGRDLLEWVAAHLEIRDVKPEDAPNAVAWARLMAAREDRVKFFAVYDKVALKIEDEDDDARDDAVQQRIDDVREHARGGVVEAANWTQQQVTGDSKGDQGGEDEETVDDESDSDG